jgi:REP element-mobilizing transposase RayT
MLPQRVALQHTPPPSVPDGSWFFVTICCEQRGVDQLCAPAISALLLEDAAYYNRQQSWALHLFLLMPDHLHCIAGFPPGQQMSVVVRNWKRLTARRTGVRWQRDFFDHRLRPNEGLHEKAAYIRQNPVRAGLVPRTEDWPHYVDFRSLAGA